MAVLSADSEYSHGVAESKQKAERQSSHQTQWAAQFAVASELCKRGCQVALTMGNHPAVDLMVVSPQQMPFSVDVKGLYKRNFWAVKAKDSRPGLFYIFAYVPDHASNQFFIADQQTVNRLIQEQFAHTEANRLKAGKPPEGSDRFPCISWDALRPHKDKWNVLPP